MNSEFGLEIPECQMLPLGDMRCRSEYLNGSEYLCENVLIYNARSYEELLAKVVNPLRMIFIDISYLGLFLIVQVPTCTKPTTAKMLAPPHLSFENSNDSALERHFPFCRAFHGVLILSRNSAFLVEKGYNASMSLPKRAATGSSDSILNGLNMSR